MPEDRAAVLEAAQAVDAAKREEEARQFTDPAFNPLIKTTPE
ncbi:MAG: hypothetical protein NTW38_03040 [Candidatus Aminicenantes bacterium]|nr:hypothetical protein [Candidatus Aminicenantes bacterium]